MDEDETRFTRLYAEHYSRVLAYALRRVARDAAREVADETFLIAWRRLADVPLAPLPWLLVTARNVLLDQRRKDHRQTAIVAELARCCDTLAARGPDEITVERVRVLQALAALAAQDRECLILTVWDGLSRGQAATVAGCATTTFTVRLHRARRRLAEALAHMDGAAEHTSHVAVTVTPGDSPPRQTYVPSVVLEYGQEP